MRRIALAASSARRRRPRRCCPPEGAHAVEAGRDVGDSITVSGTARSRRADVRRFSFGVDVRAARRRPRSRPMRARCGR